MEKITQSYQRRATATKAAFQSKDAFIRAIETEKSAQRSADSEDRNPWKNEDLDISPPEHWTWRWWDFGAYWFSYGFSPGVWNVGSALVAVGLTAWQAIICVFIGYSAGAIGAVLHSRSAAVYHFGFPVESRIPWGMRAAYFPVLVRVLTGIIWTGVSVTQGGYYVAILFRCIFGDSFYTIANTLPVDQGLTTQQLIGLIIVFVITLPLIAVPIPKIRHVFTVKSFIMPPVIIGLFAFCMVQTNVTGKSAGTFATTNTSMSGSTLAWAILSGINSMMGKTSTLVVNQPDVARYAHSKQSPVWSQAIFLPIGNTGCAALGIFATAAIQNAWGTLIWNPWDLSNAILTKNWNNGTRAWVAVVQLAFILSQVAGNIGANIIPCGADSMTLLPRFLNIKRGMYLTFCISIIICPWKILKSASSFLAFLGGYSIFLGPILGIFITDYFVVRRGNIVINDLFNPEGRYWYTQGVNWRCVVAYISAVVFTLPGFVNLFGTSIPIDWIHLYQISWFYTCTVSSVVYFCLCMIGGFAKEERTMKFEQLSYEGDVLFGRESSDVEDINVLPEKEMMN